MPVPNEPTNNNFLPRLFLAWCVPGPALGGAVVQSETRATVRPLMALSPSHDTLIRRGRPERSCE